MPQRKQARSASRAKARSKPKAQSKAKLKSKPKAKRAPARKARRPAPKARPAAKRPRGAAKRPRPTAKRPRGAGKPRRAAPGPVEVRPGARGVELVDAVIAQVRADLRAGRPSPIGKPRPAPAVLLDGLTFPEGQALSPGLRRWLDFDAAWLGWFADPAYPSFAPRPLHELVAAASGAEAAAPFAPFAGGLLPFGFLPLRGGRPGEMLALYVGQPDGLGELPVFWVRPGPVPALGLYAPGFDVWLAEQLGLVRLQRDAYEDLFRNRLYKDAMREQAGLNFGSHESLRQGELGFPSAG